MFKKIDILEWDMATKYLIDIVINKEKLSDGSPIFVAHCPRLGIASQGYSTDEAMKNIKEAIELYLEEQPEKYTKSPKIPNILDFCIYKNLWGLSLRVKDF